MSKETLNTNSYTKGELAANSHTKEQRKGTGGYGRAQFGVSKYGQLASEVIMKKEPLNSKIS